MIQSFYFFFNAALGIIYSFLPVYLKSLGYTGTEVANIMVLDSIIGLLGISILWGWISDRTQKPALMLKLLAFGLALSFIPILSGQYFLIFIGYAIFGFFSNPIGGISDSLAVMKAKEKGIDFGRIRVWASIGWLGATIIIGFVLAIKGMNIKIKSASDILLIFSSVFEGKNINWSDPIVIFVIIGGFVLTFLSALGFKERKYEKRDSAKVGLADIKLIFKNKFFLVFLMVVILHIICLRSYFFLFGIHVQSLNLSPTILSIAFAIGTLAEIAAFYSFGFLKKKFKLEVLIAAAAALSIIRWSVIANSTSPVLLILIQILHSASSGLFIAAAVSLVAEAAESKMLVTYQQVYNYAMAIGNLIGTYVSAITFDMFKSAVPVFYIISGFEGIAIVLVLLSLKLKKKHFTLQEAVA